MSPTTKEITKGITIESGSLRPMLQEFNEQLGQYQNAEKRYLLGLVLTIIDAAIADPDQRKAIKDLINGAAWNPGGRAHDTAMMNPHSDLRAICKVIGFELYEPSALPPTRDDDLSFEQKRYKNVLHINQ